MDLVVNVEKLPEISDDEAIRHLLQKKALYDGVCISGGEPTLQSGLRKVFEALKAEGFLVKLDTNGSRFEVLMEWVEAGLVDYVALDIKTSLEKYPQVISFGQPDELIDNVKKTIQFLKTGGKVDYEFRSTAFPPYFEESDLEGISKIVEGTKRYYLQQYNPQKTLGNVMNVTPFSAGEIENLRDFFAPFVGVCEVR